MKTIVIAYKVNKYLRIATLTNAKSDFSQGLRTKLDLQLNVEQSKLICLCKFIFSISRVRDYNLNYYEGGYVPIKISLLPLSCI